jgi:hypothetical protein
MKTLLEAIKQHPEEFISTCKSRARTTPNQTNRFNHLSLSVAIRLADWDAAASLLLEPDYRKPLEGVVFCLDMGYDYSIKSKIIELFEEGKLV